MGKCDINCGADKCFVSTTDAWLILTTRRIELMVLLWYEPDQVSIIDVSTSSIFDSKNQPQFCQKMYDNTLTFIYLEEWLQICNNSWL